MHFFNLFGSSELTNAILREDWSSVKAVCELHPAQAKAWSTRKGFFDGEHDSHLLPIHQAVALRPPADALDALIRAYPQGVLCKETSFKRLPLHVALQSSDTCEVVRLLLSYAPDAAAECDILERIPLHYACSNGASLQTVEALLAAYPRGATSQDIHGWLPIHVACHYGVSSDIIAQLLASNPNSVVDKTEKGSTPLKLIAKVQCKDKDEIMSMLVEKNNAMFSTYRSNGEHYGELRRRHHHHHHHKAISA